MAFQKDNNVQKQHKLGRFQKAHVTKHFALLCVRQDQSIIEKQRKF